MRLFRRSSRRDPRSSRGDPRQRASYGIAYEHPTQAIASAFLRAVADDDPLGVWERLSRETRGLLEGMHALRAGLALHEAAGGDDSERVRAVVAPLRAAVLRALGGAARVLTFGVSGARVVDRGTVYVLLLPDVAREGIVPEAEWKPAHLIAFVHESGAPPGGSGVPPGGSAEWLVDLGRTAQLSADAQLPDPLGVIR